MMKDNETENALVYRLAGVNAQITGIDQECYSFLSAYSAFGQADLTIGITPSDLALERAHADRPDYSDAYLESLVVYRKIAEQMPHYDTFLFHGSAIAVDGVAYIFTAKSGTGKSTHTRLWRKLLGDRAVMVNDDKPLIKVHKDGTATVYGTPWDGKHHLSSNIAVPVRAICILERAPDNHIRKITKAEALPILIQQTYRPADPTALAETLILLDRLNVNLYLMGCNIDISAAEMSYQTLKEE